MQGKWYGVYRMLIIDLTNGGLQLIVRTRCWNCFVGVTHGHARAKERRMRERYRCSLVATVALALASAASAAPIAPLV